MITQLLIEFLNRVTQERARHGGGMFIQEAQQFLAIHFTGCPQHPAGCFVDQVLFVFQQNLSDFESVGDLALPDKLAGTDNRSAAFPNIL